MKSEEIHDKIETMKTYLEGKPILKNCMRLV